MPPCPLIALLALSSFEVQGPSTCPRPEAVKARLSSVRIDGDHLVELQIVRGFLQVRLLDRSGTLLGERDLERNSSCEELAEATAVLVSAWTIDVPAMELPALEPETQPAAPLIAPPIQISTPKVEATPFTETLIHLQRPSDQRAGAHDFNIGVSLALRERMTRAEGLLASYVFWPFDGLALEASFHWHVFSHGFSDLGIGANLYDPSFDTLPHDLYAPVWAIGFNAIGSGARGPARWAGILRGPALELYGVFGVGFGEIQRDFIFSNIGLDGQPNDSRITPIFQGGLGLRIYGFREVFALELELRDLFYEDPDGGITNALQLHTGIRVSLDPKAWHADDPDDRPRKSLANRLIITPMGGFSLNDDLVTTSAFTLNATYQFFDFLAAETIGGYFAGRQSSISKEVRELSQATMSWAHMTELVWMLGTGAKVNALRGRFAPFGLPFDADITLYLAGGIGFGQTEVPCEPGELLDEVEHGFGATCPDASSDLGPVELEYEPRKLAFIGHAGIGVLLHVFDLFALSLEVRDFIFQTTVFRPAAINPGQVFTQSVQQVLLAQVGASLLLF